MRTHSLEFFHVGGVQWGPEEPDVTHNCRLLASLIVLDEQLGKGKNLTYCEALYVVGGLEEMRKGGRREKGEDSWTYCEVLHILEFDIS